MGLEWLRSRKLTFMSSVESKIVEIRSWRCRLSFLVIIDYSGLLLCHNPLQHLTVSCKELVFRQFLCSSENIFSSAQCAVMTLNIVAAETLNVLNSYGNRSFQKTRANGLAMLEYWQDEDFYDTQKVRAPHLHTISLKAKNGKK